MSDFELPSDTKTRTTVLENPDFEMEPAIALPPVESDFETQAQQIIERSPQPEQTRKILEQATAIHGVTKLPWDDAFNKAGVLATTKEPQAKKLVQAITDRWKAEQLSIQIGQAGNAARKALRRGDTVEYERKIKEFDSLTAQLPALEDVTPAYPDNIFGKVTGFGRRMLTGAAGLISQQVEMHLGKQAQEEVATAMEENPLTAEPEPERGEGVFAYIGSMYAAQLRGETAEAIGFGVAGKQKYWGMGEVEGGTTFVNMIKKGVDPGIADRFAIGIGAINNALEFAQVISFIKMFPGADTVISKVASGLTRKLLLGPILKNTALRLTAKLAMGVTEELSQELAQEAVTFYGENWAIEVNNATKGTALEGNKDFVDRAKQIVYDFLPGVLALGAIPIGFQAMQAMKKGEGAKATAKVAPIPMETVRTDIAKAIEVETPNVETARATLDVAETAKATEIAQADVLTPQMVREAVELADMQEAVEERAQAGETQYTPIMAKSKKPWQMTRQEFEELPKAYRGLKKGQPEGVPIYITPHRETAVLHAKETGKGFLIAEGRILNSAVLQPDVEVEGFEDRKLSGEESFRLGSAITTWDNFVPDKHEMIVREALEQGKSVPPEVLAEYPELQSFAIKRAQAIKTQPIVQPVPTSENVRTSIESGKWLDDITISHFHEEEWAKSEIARREDLRELASYLADTGLATSFDSFMTAAKETEVTPQSAEYYQGIWDTTPKAEVELDEAQEVSTEARIDATIAAEEKQAKRIPVTDRLLEELEKTPMWRPDLEKVSDVLAAKELPVTVVEGEELNAAQIANELGHNKKRLVQRMTHDFLKPPSAGIGSVAINQIRALQESYTVKETKSLDKARKALTSWQTAHPSQALIPEAKAIMNRKGIKDISVGELIDLYQQSRDIRKQGAITEKARRERIKARRVQMATDMLAEIPGGVVAKRLGEFASIETQKQEKVFARKGKIKSNILHPLRLFQSLGPAFQKTFWDNRKAWEGREIIRQKGWDRGIRDLFEKTGTTAKEMLRKVPGTNYYIDDLMTYYGQMQDPNGRKAILFGNDEDETKISRLVAELPQKYRDFVDGVIELNSKGYPEVEKIQIETNGIAAPKVDRYLRLRRQEDFGKPFSAELSTQAAIRESARIAGLQKGFTNQRVTFKEGTQQARFRTDFMNILVEQIAQESKFVEGEEWARDMDWLLGGKSKESKQFLEAVKQKHGQPVVTFLKDYVNAVIQPESFNGKNFQGLISRVFRNFSDAALMYKLSTIFIQLEGPFRYLSQLDAKQWPYLFAGLWKATIQPGKTLAAMYERSPVMQAMADSGAIDPALHEGRGLRHARSEIGLNLQMARKEMREAGYAGLKAMNAWTIASGWTAVYQANLAKTGNIETAVKMADEATFLTQPSGELADAPRMYWTSKKNIILAFLQRFSRANNQMAQMMTVDLWKDLKTGHPAKALGVVLSFAIGAYLNSLRRRKRPPKDVQEYLEDGIAGITDNLGAITFGAAPAFVAGATSGFKPGGINPLEPVYRAGAIGKDILYGNVSGKEVWRLINTVMQATGLPSPAAENVVRTMYDFENMGFRFDPIELFGRRPKGE